MINDPFTVLNAILQSNTTITAMLGVYQNTSIPLIMGGVLAETETDLPCITFYPNNADPIQILNNDTFTVNCYAETLRDSYLLARTVVDQLNEEDSGVDGYQARTTAKILTSIPDPTAKEVNTPVEVRIVNIFN